MAAALPHPPYTFPGSWQGPGRAVVLLELMVSEWPSRNSLAATLRHGLFHKMVTEQGPERVAEAKPQTQPLPRWQSH